jgi:hypothetical protein
MLLTIIFSSITFPSSFAAEHENVIPGFLEQYGILISITVFSIGIFLAFWANSRTIKQQSYHKLRIDHIAQMSKMIDDKTFHKLIKINGDEKIDFDNLSIFEKKKIILFYMIEFDLYERLRIEYIKKILMNLNGFNGI